MRRVLLAVALLLALAPVLPAGDFDWMVREFARESGAEPTQIPLMGLASLAINVARPAGASDFRLAVFEDVNIAMDRFNHAIDVTAGAGWKPLVRVRSRDGESINIYMQELGAHVRLLIANYDHDEATLMEMRLKTQDLIRFVNEHQGRHSKD